MVNFGLGIYYYITTHSGMRITRRENQILIRKFKEFKYISFLNLTLHIDFLKITFSTSDFGKMASSHYVGLMIDHLD